MKDRQCKLIPGCGRGVQRYWAIGEEKDRGVPDKREGEDRQPLGGGN